MFSFLNLLSQGLGYFGFINIGSRGNRVLNQIYTTAGILGDLYLFYAGSRFIINGFIIHGVLLVVASVALVYFLYINFYYYFLKREAPFDVSPVIEKKLGLKQFNEEATHSLTHLQNLHQRDDRDAVHEIRQSIPAHLITTQQTRRNLQALVQDLIKGDHLNTDYAGLSYHQIFKRLKQDHHRPVYAIGAGALVPFYQLRHIDNEWRVFAGNDKFHARYVGKIARIGLQPIQEVNQHAHSWVPVLTSVILVGGPYQMMGRSRVYQHHQPDRKSVV